MMKKIASLMLALVLSLSLCIPAFAAESETEEQVSGIQQAAEIQDEMKSAEEMLGGACTMKSQETQRVGDYVVETRLYVLEDNAASARSGERGGVSSHTWRRRGESEWCIKVLFSAMFYYNGSTAICIPEKSNFWVIRPDNSLIHDNYNPKEHYKDGTTAKASCQYARDEPGDSSIPEVWSTLIVTCTKAGVIGIESEVEHSFWI